jgi:hypothetical protein
MPPARISRRHLIGAALLGAALPGWARGGAAPSPAGEVSGDSITLRIGHGTLAINGRPARAITINGSAPARCCG